MEAIPLQVYAIVFIIGLVIGSFLNVCIYRLQVNKSVVFPASHCTSCNSKIKIYDNIPVLSYLILRGKCRNCGEKISVKYPIVEIFTGVIFLLIFNKYFFYPQALVYLFFACILIVLSVIDIETYTLPDKLSFLLIITGFLSCLFNQKLSFESSYIGAATYAFPFLLIYGFGKSVLKKDIMGFGDVKLGAGIGAFLGYASLSKLYMFFMTSFVLGSIISLLLIALKIRSKKELVPFGPFLALSALLMIIFDLDISLLYF